MPLIRFSVKLARTTSAAARERAGLPHAAAGRARRSGGRGRAENRDKVRTRLGGRVVSTWCAVWGATDASAQQLGKRKQTLRLARRDAAQSPPSIASSAAILMCTCDLADYHPKAASGNASAAGNRQRAADQPRRSQGSPPQWFSHLPAPDQGRAVSCEAAPLEKAARRLTESCIVGDCRAEFRGWGTLGRTGVLTGTARCNVAIK